MPHTVTLRGQRDLLLQRCRSRDTKMKGNISRLTSTLKIVTVHTHGTMETIATATIVLETIDQMTITDADAMW